MIKNVMKRAESKITYTPISNIKDNRVIDISLVITKSFDTFRALNVKDIKRNLERDKCPIDLSLYDDHLIFDKVEYKILSMLTK